MVLKDVGKIAENIGVGNRVMIGVIEEHLTEQEIERMTDLPKIDSQAKAWI